MAQKQQFRSFADMIANSQTPILVDFYADWCGPCRMMAGILNEVKGLAGDGLTIVKIDTERYQQIASEWQIYSLPTLILFRGGQPLDRIEGVMAAQPLWERLQGHLVA